MRIVLIVGLGNPGNQYEFTRHNAGFIVIDQIAQHFGFPVFKQKGKALISSCDISGVRAVLLKPQTFMNLSGDAVLPVVSFFKISENDIAVIHDDLDLSFGDYRYKFGGGSGGHNGLKSIDSKISNKYWRIRVGIGRPENKSDVVDYVLGKFSKDDISRIEKDSENLCNIVSRWISCGEMRIL